MTRRSRPLALGAAALAVAVLLSGCMSWFVPPTPETTSTPTGERVDEALQPYYSQALVWENCG
ncbi:hypothetical protein, partial [Priestia megaterium]|uniref:hypothetical protein n=1 Tax=Priestia megaterium TaxID=1404 RepID=UPI0035B5F552